MRTNLHHYYIDTDKPEGREAYEALRAQLKVSHKGKFFNVLADTRKDRNRGNEIEEVELDPAFLFNNQWNELGNNARRLFDWYEGIYPNKKIKEGHWLEITPEMEAIRQHTLTCGYCGKYVKDTDQRKWHCEKCLGSEYLKESELGLLRLLPVADKGSRSFDMTESERAEIMPLYKGAQGLGQISREVAAKSRNRKKVAALIPQAEKESAELMSAARVETEALTWLLDHELNFIDNVIYYTHTKRFCFGWHQPLSADERSKLLDGLSEFPFDYDLK
jgi:hypothetical protein